MSKRGSALEEAELFLEHGLHVSSRTIKLDLDPEEDGHTIGFGAASKFAKNLHILNTISNDPITVVMNSQGGSVYDGWAIFDLIKFSASPVTITVLGACMSMASVILQAATLRLAYPFTRFMLHDGSAEAYGNIRDMEAASEVDKHDRFRTYRVYSERSGKPASYWNRKLAKDYYLTAEEALEEGLIDGIVGVTHEQR